MRILEGLILFLLVVFLGIGLSILWVSFPTKEPVKYEEFSADFKYENGASAQFYPNMRYRDREIDYYIDAGCGEKRRNDTEIAFGILSGETSLRFYPASDERSADIDVLCSDVAPEPEEEGHFVAGEGGPSKVINNSIYNVILNGKVSLYRNDKCDEPKIALHEVLHALGFDHNNNLKSIMYPTTNCEQELDQYIIDEINKLYSVDSKPDLAIGDLSANSTGRYLNFEVGVVNIGLKNSRSSTLRVFSGSEELKDFDLEAIEIGTKKVWTVQNLRIPRNTEKVTFVIEADEDEISEDNNVVSLGLAS